MWLADIQTCFLYWKFEIRTDKGVHLKLRELCLLHLRLFFPVLWKAIIWNPQILVRGLTANHASLQATSSYPIRSVRPVFSTNVEYPGGFPFPPFASQALGDNVSSKIHSATFTSHLQENDDISWGPLTSPFTLCQV